MHASIRPLATLKSPPGCRDRFLSRIILLRNEIARHVHLKAPRGVACKSYSAYSNRDVRAHAAEKSLGDVCTRLHTHTHSLIYIAHGRSSSVCCPCSCSCA